MIVSQFVLPAGIQFAQVSIVCNGSKVLISAASSQKHSSCPVCKERSRTIHSHYNRMLADLPISGHNVQILLRSRKFFCNNRRCYRKIFTERFTSEVAAYGRRFSRSTNLLAKIGLELGGNKGAVISSVVGCPVSSATMIRTVKKLSYSTVEQTSGIIGVDDWAFKKGRNYGTIIVDLGNSRVVDLLADRDAGTLATWLEKHPEVHTVSRDRASAYALGIRKGAPQAIQVADRFHLLVNLRNALQRSFQRHSAVLKETFRLFNEQNSPHIQQNDEEKIIAAPITKPSIPPSENPSLYTGNVSSQRQYKFEKAKELYAKGYKIRAIAKHLNANRKSIRKYIQLEVLSARTLPVYSPFMTNFDKYRQYLIANYKPGITTFRQLHQAIVASGFDGKYSSFCDRMNQLINGGRVFCQSENTSEVLKPLLDIKMWSTTKLSFMALSDSEKLNPTEKRFLDFLYSSSSIIRETAELASKFKKLFVTKEIGSLEQWIQRALIADSSLKTFAKGIQLDFEAVNQAVVSSISNGRVEGQVNKLKTVKRKMYGRASFDLLKTMMLATAT
jgi:transposase